jgi:pSer/pThr/pTyr-binding forkhead associated (FHA) protein
MAALVIINGEQAGSYFQIANRPLTAGRDPARDIQIVDPKVSRKHFQVRKDEETYTIIEFKTTNGVYVNGTKVEGEQVLNDGDQIQIGDTVLGFSLSDDPDRTNALNRFKRADRQVREDRTLQ